MNESNNVVEPHTDDSFLRKEAETWCGFSNFLKPIINTYLLIQLFVQVWRWMVSVLNGIKRWREPTDAARVRGPVFSERWDESWRSFTCDDTTSSHLCDTRDDVCECESEISAQRNVQLTAVMYSTRRHRKKLPARRHTPSPESLICTDIWTHTLITSLAPHSCSPTRIPLIFTPVRNLLRDSPDSQQSSDIIHWDQCLSLQHVQIF